MWRTVKLGVFFTLNKVVEQIIGVMLNGSRKITQFLRVQKQMCECD